MVRLCPHGYLLTQASPDGCPECRGLHRPWTDEEVDKALDLQAAGRTNAEIAEILHRTEDGVKEKLQHVRGLGLETPDL